MRYPLPDSFEWGIHGYLCLPLPDDKQQRANIIGALSQLLNWYTYERDDEQSGAKTAQAMRDLWLPDAFEILENCGGTERTVIERVPYTETVYIESEEEVAQFPYYQKVNGIWYLGMPCEPCGGVEWVPLGAGGALGTGGGTQGRNPAIPYLPDGTTVSGSGGASCFASKAVPYFADQCGEFWEWMVDASITAIEYADLLTPVTEGFDAAAAIADAISGSGTTRELVTLGIDVLKAVISASGNISALQDNWTFTTTPSYGEIKSWIDSTTFPNEPAIAKRAWQVWALRLIVAKHYAALNTMLVECGTGKDLGSIASGSVVFENAQYRIIEVSGYPKNITATLNVQSDWDVPALAFDAIAFFFDPSIPRNQHITFESSAGLFFDYNNVGQDWQMHIVEMTGGTNWQSVALLAGAGNYADETKINYIGAANPSGNTVTEGTIWTVTGKRGQVDILPVSRLWLMQKL